MTSYLNISSILLSVRLYRSPRLYNLTNMNIDFKNITQTKFRSRSL